MGRLAVILLAATILSGCGNTARHVDLGSLGNEPYLGLKEKLSYRTGVELGYWRHIDITATLLHREITMYRSDAPDRGTGVEFFVRDPYGEFQIGGYELVVHTGPGKVSSILGLGTARQVVRGQMADSADGVRLIPLEGAVDVKSEGVKRFILVLPIDIDAGHDRSWITGTDIYDSDRTFSVRWSFGTEE